MRRTTSLLLALLLPIGLAACGDDDSGGSSGPEPVDLGALLLTAADLGDGWDGGPSGADDLDESDGPDCLQDPPESTATDELEADFTFGDPETGFPSLQQKLSAYEDDDALAEAFDAAIDAIDGCDTFTYSSEGSTVAGTIERLDLDAGGDESAAFEMTLSTQGFDFTAYLTYVRSGTTRLGLYYVDAGDADLDAFADIVGTAVAKLEG